MLGRLMGHWFFLLSYFPHVESVLIKKAGKEERMSGVLSAVLAARLADLKSSVSVFAAAGDGEDYKSAFRRKANPDWLEQKSAVDHLAE